MTTEISRYSLVILAGGLAKRLGSQTQHTPKSLIHVADEPFIDHQLHLVKKNGIQKVVICVGHLGDQIKNYVQDGSRFGLDVSYSFDGAILLGTGGAIKKALPLLPDIFWVMYGDSYLDTSFWPILNFFESNNKLGLMTVLHNQNLWDKSNVLFNDGILKKYDKENPSPEMRHIDFGLSLFRKNAFNEIVEESFGLSKLQMKLVQKKELIGFEVFERFYEIGSINGLKEANEFFISRRM